MAAPATFGSYSERFWRSCSGDWIAHLILTTCSAAVINFWQVLAELFARYERLQPHNADRFEITACYFGPPPAFYPRFIVMVVLLIATFAVCKRIATRRFISAVCLTVALGVYVCWWLDSYRAFRNFQHWDIHFLNHIEIRQAAYLYGGTYLDLAVALLTSVCLVIVLDRLFDGEKVGARN